jgi:hypothetical protein
MSSHYAKVSRRFSCTRLELCLICLTIALFGILTLIATVWLTVFDGYKIFTNDSDWWPEDLFSMKNASFGIDPSAIHNDHRVCTSKECTRISSLIISNLKDGDPCQNFYEFACGNYASDHDPLLPRSVLTDLQARIHKKLREILEVQLCESNLNQVTLF